MSGVHLHLLVNHAPILGALFAVALLAASLVWSPDVLRRAGFVALLVVGVSGVIANQSGEPAEDAVRRLPGVTRAAIHEHEEMGEKSFLLAAVVGVGALAGLVRWRRRPVPNAAGVGALAAAVVVSGMMAYTGLLGGRIRHTEVRPGATPADAAVIEPPRARGPRPPE